MMQTRCPGLGEALTRGACRFGAKRSQRPGYMRVVWPRRASDGELQGMGCSEEVYQRKLLSFNRRYKSGGKPAPLLSRETILRGG